LESKKLKACVVTLGCRVNQYESQSILESLENKGVEILPFSDGLDIYVLNTCSVTAQSDKKSRQFINRFKKIKENRPDCIVAVLGCFIQRIKNSSEDTSFLDGVDVIIGNGGKNRAADMIFSVINKKNSFGKFASLPEKFEETPVTKSKNVKAYIKIQDGCNNFCSYCIVPYLRGRIRSRNTDCIEKEALTLAKNGFKEITLTGIEVSAFQCENEEYPLVYITKKLSKADGIERIRFGSLNPRLITKGFCEELSKCEKFLPHFHLSLQSGSDAVLSAMRRNYTRSDILSAYENIFSYFDKATLSSDIICGFAGESDEDFLDTVSIIKNCNMLHTHIFPYSVRKGTLAEGFKNKVSADVITKRCEILKEISEKEAIRSAEKFYGTYARVLVEKTIDGRAFGYTENNIYVSFDFKNHSVGDIVPVLLLNECAFFDKTLTVKAKNLTNL